ncbi:hypothetical protein SAMN04488109_1009 [Chryseolinea serpens]|uniref:DUF4386 domain-containing protein n=1 Tax=Chryseolinea serpens TaxID=947013 RepID=A0A1M5L471_9BACT|nr:hypothetical protein [Chryseolinea serpens]SHG59818.1 hypothetical protein SAMN04488109_1009 [Chryseolinea serpens]
MNESIRTAGFLLMMAAITFWLGWFFMPDPGTTDAAHILQIVKAARNGVLNSVIAQIVSSLLFSVALCLVSQHFLPHKKMTLAGIVLLNIGAMGWCVDAFFHLLAYYMTDNTVHIQEDVVRVMAFMQTGGLIFLIPLLLPFFIGTGLLTIGLNKQGIISKRPLWIMIAGFVLALVIGLVSIYVFDYHSNLASLTLLGGVAFAQAWMGFEWAHPDQCLTPANNDVGHAYSDRSAA